MSTRLVPIAAAALGSIAAMLVVSQPAEAAPTLPDGFSRSTYARGLVNPVDMEFAPDGRLFVTEQAGKLRVVRKNGSVGTLLNISAKVDHDGERGMQGIAFDPDFATNHWIYVEYTRKATSSTPLHNQVARFRIENGKAVPSSERIILKLNALHATNHMGGSLEFGSGGRLFVTAGDNGDSTNAQSLGTLLGKVLRINKDGTIPSSNPFFDKAKGKNRAIWARGLRNPFKIAVKPDSSTVFINDVGENTFEEINRGAAGRNFGWPRREGPGGGQGFTGPVFSYRHSGAPDTSGCAITGGTFYQPKQVTFPQSYVGDYFFADLCGGWIRKYDPATDTAQAFGRGFPERSIVDLEVAAGGSLYSLMRASGTVVRIGHR